MNKPPNENEAALAANVAKIKERMKAKDPTQTTELLAVREGKSGALDPDEAVPRVHLRALVGVPPAGRSPLQGLSRRRL